MRERERIDVTMFSCLQVTQGRHGEVIAGAPHHAGHHYSDGFDHVSGAEELHRPASYMVMSLFFRLF